MAISIERLCNDIEACIGKDTYGSPETLDIDKLKDGGHKIMCAGLIYAALVKQGHKTFNGSNTMWRKWLADKGSISNHTSTNGYPKNVNPRKSTQLVKGMLVFKWNSSDPKHDGLGDYQHVGIVTRAKPLRIVHASSETGTVSVDTKVGKFCAWGWLKGMPEMEPNDQPESTKTETATKEEVKAMTGTLRVVKTLNVRNGKGTKYGKLGQLAVGTEIEFAGNMEDEWVQINYNGKAAYICTHQGANWYVEGVSITVEDAPENDQPESTEPEDDEPYADNTVIAVTGSTDEKIYQLAMHITNLYARMTKAENELELLRGDE